MAARDARVEELLAPDLRTRKPRTSGLTIVLDKGLGIRAVRDLVEVSGDHVDFAKIAWGSALITGGLEDKLQAYRTGGITPLLGGTLFEYAYGAGKLDTLLAWVRDLRVSIEISDGVFDIPRPERLQWLERFAAAAGGPVFSELGGKVQQHDTLDWDEAIAEELRAGAHHVVVEGREVGPVGQPFRQDLVDRLLRSEHAERLVFEALERPQQVRLVQTVGPNVNLGNILPEHVLTLESFRRGLKEHTLRGRPDRTG
ncbi:MAG TPA: phosphosulfolactate synthase [Myxococcales bacterium LLY-WYZ-16_1]|jgi:phosphosulfolactate synthase|nr:phosphosulfolactate synthase [Myxococcales bacterium LLY-WYZ-16_1]